MEDYGQHLINLNNILLNLRIMGFTVELLPSEIFSFKFMTRRYPLNVKVLKYISPKEFVLDVEDYFSHDYTIEDVLDTAEKSLKPNPTGKYMESFLATWEEFKNIRYKDGKITLLHKRL